LAAGVYHMMKWQTGSAYANCVRKSILFTILSQATSRNFVRIFKEIDPCLMFCYIVISGDGSVPKNPNCQTEKENADKEGA
jgi:L-cystine uptake protein TcyP (sodium:dicarboxylate symporter family)